MSDGERRKLVFQNLANGAPVAHVMLAFHMSEKEVMADFAFVAAKIRSYRFERGMPMLPCSSIEEAKAARVELLHTMQRVNADKDPRHNRIETLPFEVGAGRPSIAEQKLLEMKMRRGA